jgi:mRNA-degrading endonuclease toxin of MazEF toxin-antitoxin module
VRDGADEVTAFLTHLANERNVSASTQNQAKGALPFLYKQVLGIDLPWLDEIVQAKRGTRLAVVLTPREVRELPGATQGPADTRQTPWRSRSRGAWHRVRAGEHQRGCEQIHHARSGRQVDRIASLTMTFDSSLLRKSFKYYQFNGSNLYLLKPAFHRRLLSIGY